MSSALLNIAQTGAHAARVALDVTAQNIANASTEGYVRRGLRLEEIASPDPGGRIGDVSLSGVRLAGIIRNVDIFRQAEVRRTGADAARADNEVAGLENIETAIEQSRVHPAIVQFESTLQRLAADPVDPALRSSLIEDARTMTQTFQLAASALDAVGASLRLEAGDAVSQVNLFAGELARINLRLPRSTDGSADQASLLDQRDALLEQLSQYTGVTATIAPDRTVEVRIGSASGPVLVSGGTANAFSSATAVDGTLTFDVGGTAVTPLAGTLAGKSQALTKLAQVHTDLDSLATGLISAVNTVQTSGVALDGSAGQQLFSGTDAASIALAFTDGALIATAPAGAGANSRNPANLDALRNALSTFDPSGKADALIFDISGAVAGRKVTRDALTAIAGNARVMLEAQSGVDLDQEAANLVRFQQAFQASGKVMQVAATLFDTMLSLR